MLLSEPRRTPEPKPVANPAESFRKLRLEFEAFESFMTVMAFSGFELLDFCA
jgi:hypothetical protein